MAITLSTVKRLFAKSGNKCALPKCQSPLVIGDHVLAEMCHIRARRKGGARYDPALSATEKDEIENLILLCPTCHTRIDKERSTFTSELLVDLKAYQEKQGGIEITPEVSRQAMLILGKITGPSGAKATAKGCGVAVAIGGDNHAPITINSQQKKPKESGGYPANSIGADANLTNYIEYLCDLYVKYMSPIEPEEGRSWAKLGKHIKTKFRLRKRTRNHLAAERFDDLVKFLIHEKLAKTPRGQKHLREGTRLCRTFDEFRSGAM